MKSEDLHIRLVDPTGKHAQIISHHRVWDRERFIAAQRQLHEVKAKDEDKRRVEIATEAEYRKFKGYKEIAA